MCSLTVACWHIQQTWSGNSSIVLESCFLPPGWQLNNFGKITVSLDASSWTLFTLLQLEVVQTEYTVVIGLFIYLAETNSIPQLEEQVIAMIVDQNIKLKDAHKLCEIKGKCKVCDKPTKKHHQWAIPFILHKNIMNIEALTKGEVNQKLLIRVVFEGIFKLSIW